MRAMLVPFGAKGGSGFMKVPLLGDVLMPGFMVPMAKGKTLFLEKFDAQYAKV